MITSKSQYFRRALPSKYGRTLWKQWHFRDGSNVKDVGFKPTANDIAKLDTAIARRLRRGALRSKNYFESVHGNSTIPSVFKLWSLWNCRNGNSPHQYKYTGYKTVGFTHTV